MDSDEASIPTAVSVTSSSCGSPAFDGDSKPLTGMWPKHTRACDFFSMRASISGAQIETSWRAPEPLLDHTSVKLLWGLSLNLNLASASGRTGIANRLSTEPS